MLRGCFRNCAVIDMIILAISSTSVISHLDDSEKKNGLVKVPN